MYGLRQMLIQEQKYLEELIIKFRPTMLLVEHDRAFVRKVGTSYVKLEPK